MNAFSQNQRDVQDSLNFIDKIKDRASVKSLAELNLLVTNTDSTTIVIFISNWGREYLNAVYYLQFFHKEKRGRVFFAFIPRPTQKPAWGLIPIINQCISFDIPKNQLIYAYDATSDMLNFGGISFSEFPFTLVYRNKKLLTRFLGSQNMSMYAQIINSTLGDSITTNPGSRGGALSWRDNVGNLWLYAGYGYALADVGLLRDLWKYDIILNEWTWVNGDLIAYDNTGNVIHNLNNELYKSLTPKYYNFPESMSSGLTWENDRNHIYLYPGFPFLHKIKDNFLLFIYDVNSKRWDSLSGGLINKNESIGIGDNFAPIQRRDGVSWTDSLGNLWLFGGQEIPSDPNQYQYMLNDLWKYDTKTGHWIFEGGDKVTVPKDYVYGAFGIYGLKGRFAPTNKPGGRYGSISWTDKNGILWLFGGFGFANRTYGYLNDLWNYDTKLNQWIWVNGEEEAYELQQRGKELKVLDKSIYNKNPIPRYGSFSWMDKIGNLWLFGGLTLATYYFNGNLITGGYQLNDLWKYDITKNQWMLIKGDSILNPLGNSVYYGQRGIHSKQNKPGARSFGSSWTDNEGNFWLFGGNGYTSSNQGGILNDLWKYDVTANEWAWIKGDSTANKMGVYGLSKSVR